MEQEKNVPGLTGNALKIIAMLTMTCDHVGLALLPRYLWLRMIGRLAMPIFAYMIAEGCRYTHDRRRYLLRLLGLGALCQIGYFAAMGSVYMCILITFSLSVGLIGVLEWAKNRKDAAGVAAAALSLGAVWFLCQVLPGLLRGTDYDVDYGIWGVLLPVLIYFGRPKLLWCALGMGMVCLDYGGIQWLCFAALPLLALYNGQRGNRSMGKLFYLYYPLHLVVIYAIAWLL